MKKLLFFFLFLLFNINLYSQDNVYDKTIYEDYGVWSIESNDDIISIEAFVTIEIDFEIKQYYSDEISYCYNLYFVSKSTYGNDTTNTWLYGVKIFINGVDVYEDQFPKGFIVSVKTQPTLIHKHYAISNNVDFEMKWEKAVYEPRIRK